MDQYTVLLWPGAGYILYPFEVTAFSEEEALTEAVKRALNEDYNIHGFYYNTKQVKELLYYYKEETKKYEDNHDFITQYLNYHYIGDLNYFVHMDNTKIMKGWNLYENSIPLKVEE